MEVSADSQQFNVSTHFPVDHKAECELSRAQFKNQARSLLPMLVFFLFIVCFAHGELQQASICVLGFASFGTGIVVVASQKSNMQLARCKVLIQLLNPVLRTIVHLICATVAPDSTFLMLFTLYLLPMSAAREIECTTQCNIYLAVNDVLAIWRFRAKLQEGTPWLSVLFMSHLVLLDLVSQKQLQKSTRHLVEKAEESTRDMAKYTIVTLFDKLCDAVVELRADCHVSDRPRRLAAMTGRLENLMHGKYFPDFLDSQHQAEFEKTVIEAKDGVCAHGLLDSGMQVSSFRTVLRDAFAQAVPVNVLMITVLGSDHKPVFVLGIDEAWQPQETKTAQVRRRVSRVKSNRVSATSQTNMQHAAEVLSYS